MTQENRNSVRFGRAKRAEAAICLLPTEKIRSAEHHPRRVWDADAVTALADSIRRHGMIQPITVRCADAEGGVYEVIAGERRLRAARMLGMAEIPCAVVEADERRAAAVSLIEAMQREKVHFFEQAEAIGDLLRNCDLTQEEAAAQLCVSQSFIANKLRLLRYGEDERSMIREGALTERHARALLRLCGEERAEAIRAVIRRRLNVAETEDYVDSLLRAPCGAYSAPEARELCRHVDCAVESARRAGQDVRCERSESREEIRLVIRIPVSAR